MSDFLGIDTSNYTTSAAIYESSHNVLLQEKMLLPVKKGEKGIRQSDAVFHHTVQLPEIIDKLFKKDGEKGHFRSGRFLCSEAIGRLIYAVLFNGDFSRNGCVKSSVGSALPLFSSRGGI